MCGNAKHVRHSNRLAMSRNTTLQVQSETLTRIARSILCFGDLFSIRFREKCEMDSYELLKSK